MIALDIFVRMDICLNFVWFLAKEKKMCICNTNSIRLCVYIEFLPICKFYKCKTSSM